ncbi:site-specific integrase [Clostridium caldaquaticum]|uniref:site-specific integrase n=1 Tax=Clostridium caldaquaticum TaxID=2940653 RepID=UPI0033130786
MIEEFIKYLKKYKKSQKTISLYTNVVEEFEKWYNENHNCELRRLKKSDLIEFEKYLEHNKHYKLSTIKVKISILLQFSIFLLYYYV